ncbi:UNVERIFIED_CONTAM: hypothetical protein H355_008739 [Colinus virginianus]|nr:hypothetical protein H355_008739 [Colinus virginianus]
MRTVQAKGQLFIITTWAIKNRHQKESDSSSAAHTDLSKTLFFTAKKSDLASPGYLSQVLKNYTGHACDGEYVSLRCPHRTTISIQSSFYGRIVPSHQLCPSRSPHSYAALIKEDVACSVGTSLQKTLDECQDRRSCRFLVRSRLFGVDPCPATGKYLLVWYKCRPNEYKSKVACEDDKLRLSCKKSMVIAIYSAIFGRTQGGSLECPYQNLGMPMIGYVIFNPAFLRAWSEVEYLKAGLQAVQVEL